MGSTLARDVVFLCTERELTRERAGMWEALQGLGGAHVLPAPLDGVEQILGWWRERGAQGRPVLVWPDPPIAYLPAGLARSPALTVCWHIDSYSVPEWRAEQARLFDLSFVFHPASVARFRELGVGDVRLLPHSVRRRFFTGVPAERVWDVAFVGSMTGAYAYRRECVAAVAATGLSMNDTAASYDYAELAQVYGRARIGLNVPQDHYLADANLRCFEVMAAGALLLTPSGSELRELGFVPGRHYLEFGSLDELRDVARRMLAAGVERETIADAGRSKTLAEFTYDQAAARMLAAIDERLAGGVGEGRATVAEEHRVGLRYFARRGHTRDAAHHFGRLVTLGAVRPRDAGDMLAAAARAVRANLRRLGQ